MRVAKLTPETKSKTTEAKPERAILRQDPPAPCAKKQEARGLHSDGCTFSSKKQEPERPQETLHGFTQQSTQTTHVPLGRT